FEARTDIRVRQSLVSRIRNALVPAPRWTRLSRLTWLTPLLLYADVFGKYLSHELGGSDAFLSRVDVVPDLHLVSGFRAHAIGRLVQHKCTRLPKCQRHNASPGETYLDATFRTKSSIEIPRTVAMSLIV